VQNACLIYRMTDATKQLPVDHLELRRNVSNYYYMLYTVERASVGRSFSGRPKSLDRRVPEDPD